MFQNEKSCPVTATMSIIGGKWKPIILWILNDDVRRFGEIKKFIPTITQKMLTQQLRELENDKLINRKVYAQVPPKVEYSLTDYGRTIMPILNAMADWGEHQKKYNGPKKHPRDEMSQGLEE
ncbi:helix-turn-helix transcriptional regulator [candidate division KSB1 bacterium]|nr:helix-turn-helix transcriptional regulator [candidate division KSB1 bacterium]